VLSEYDAHLRKFEHKKALDVFLKRVYTTEMINVSKIPYVVLYFVLNSTFFQKTLLKITVTLYLQDKMMGTHPEIFVSFLKELVRRRALEKALAGRDENSLYIIVKFVARYANYLIH